MRILMIGAVLVMLNLAGCNTMHGFGQDLEKAGDAIKKKAD